MNTGADAAPCDDDLVIVEDEGILRITFNRPRARNALTLGMYERLEKLCLRMGEEFPSVRVAILSGQGGEAFASGTDISEFRRFENAQDAIAYERRISRVLDALSSCPIPTIAAVAGACVGGGLAIAACCDIRIAASNARFGVPIARTLGNCLSLTSHRRLGAIIGPARLRELVITARLYDAREALAAGFVSELSAGTAELEQRATALARTIASHAPITMQVTKESLAVLQHPVDAELEEQLTLKAYLSEDFSEGVAAFLARRAPRWKGR